MKKRERVDALCRAALLLTQEKGWATVTLPDIAEATGLSFSKVFKLAPSKVGVLKLINAWFDDRLLLELDRSAKDQSVRDQLFDVMMQRLEVMEAYKPALISIAGTLRRDVSVALALRPQGLATMRLMLEAVGVSTSGVSGALRTRGLGVVWLMTVRQWLDDDDPGLSKTMAVLDRRLRQWVSACDGVSAFSKGKSRCKPDGESVDLSS